MHCAHCPMTTMNSSNSPHPGANDGHRMLSVTLTAKEFSRNGDGSLNPDGNGVDMDYGTLGNVAMGMTTRLAYFGAGADPLAMTAMPVTSSRLPSERYRWSIRLNTGA